MKHILDLFEHTVESCPDKKAAGYKEETYSFKDLKEKAMKLGAAIQAAMGDGKKEQAVAVMVNRGIHTLAGFLAVLYSGNYYVPVDPAMPVEKMKTLLGDCEAGVLICEEENEALLEKLG